MSTLAAAELLQKHSRMKARADELKEHLPWSLSTPDELRAYTVWWGCEERAWEAYRKALAIVFDTAIDDDQEASAAIRRRDLDELGKRLKQFVDFCRQEVEPLLDRLEKGVDLLQAVEDGSQRELQYRAHFINLRQKLREALPVAWRLISPAAAMYRRLPDDLREEAEKRWGPLTGTDPHDFGPVWHRH